jgi:uncharacterized protein (DUF2252 family)
LPLEEEIKRYGDEAKHLNVERVFQLLERSGSVRHGYRASDSELQRGSRPGAPSAQVPRHAHRHLRVLQPKWQTEAHRVVELQRRIQAVPMAFLHPAVVGGRAYTLRGLQPSEDRIRLNRDAQSMTDLEQLMVTTGKLVAWAQLRGAGREGSAIADELIDFGGRRKWKRQLLDASHDCAVQVRQDAALYNAAFDDGALVG